MVKIKNKMRADMKLFYEPNFFVVTHLLSHKFKKPPCSYFWSQSFRKWCFPSNPPSNFCLAYGLLVAPLPWPPARCRMQGDKEWRLRAYRPYSAGRNDRRQRSRRELDGGSGFPYFAWHIWQINYFISYLELGIDLQYCSKLFILFSGLTINR